MRRDLVHSGAGQLKYEIREIVQFAHELEKWNISISWENIGDPIQKGEKLPAWIKEIIEELAADDSSYAYVDTQGTIEAREFLSEVVNKRGGCSITPRDILFFNGLGDAVAKVFGFLKRESRVLGPSPAYSTLSSAEAAHSGYAHLSYMLDPANAWMPDIEDIELKVKYNDSIAGILIINPDNPTGTVYSRELLQEFVLVAKKYDLFLVCDETYAHIVYNGAKTTHLSEVIEDVPGMALRSISKEYPWPGARCGWIEVFNQDKDENFSRYIQSIIAAKRLEVCSTSLPQMSIPRVIGDPRYLDHIERRKRLFEARAKEAYAAFEGRPGIYASMPKGAFYFTVVFEEGALRDGMRLEIEDKGLRSFIEERTKGVAPDKRFVYYLLAATGICVVPLSGFACDLPGFRLTLLETDDEKRSWIYRTIGESIGAYLGSK